VLNYGFIVRLGWASAGAGWGTALSQYLMLLTGLCLVYRDIPWARLNTFRAEVLDGVALRAAFQLNSDILIRTFALVTTFAVFTNLSSSFGTTILAANTLLLQVVSFAAYFIDGLAFATESYSGLFRGRGERRELRRLLGLSGGISLALGLLFAGGCLLFSRPLLSVLTSHDPVIAQAQAFVGWLLPVLGFGSVAYMLDGYFLGLTEGYILKTSSLVATLVGFAPVAIASMWLKSPQILWLGMTSFMAARAMTLGLQVPDTLKQAHSAQDSI
jgi:multidrug resistance protein, MATE family